MPRKILAYFRQNAIALLALFVALGGTSYAALTINGSQIRNRSIQAVKFNPKSVAASIKAWAIVSANGNSVRAVASSSPVTVAAITNGETITWRNRGFARNCMPSITPLVSAPHLYGAVTAEFTPRDGFVVLNGFGPDAVGRPQSATVMIVCP